MQNNNNDNRIVDSFSYDKLTKALIVYQQIMDNTSKWQELNNQELIRVNKRKRMSTEDATNFAQLLAIYYQKDVQRTLENKLLVNEDIYLSIYMGSFIHIDAVRIRRNIAGRETDWWRLTHPVLNDMPRLDNNGRIIRESTFREHYRITKYTFELLVNLLCRSEAYRGTVEKPSSWPVWKQVAIVIWRLSCTHFGYRMAKDKFGVGHGSYNEFTDRFSHAMTNDVLPLVIKWPTTVERTREIANGFAKPSSRDNEHLKDVIGAIDGKLVVIQKPKKKEDGDKYADRKNHISMSLMAVCDDRKRFINILTGVPGKQYL